MATPDRTQVRDVMSTPLETITETATLREAARRLQEEDFSALFVPTAEGGIVTNTDVRDAVAAGLDPDEATVSDVMTAPVETITADLQLQEAAAMMTNFGIKHLPVVDRDGDYVGMISTTDLTTVLA